MLFILLKVSKILNCDRDTTTCKSDPVLNLRNTTHFVSCIALRSQKSIIGAS